MSESNSSGCTRVHRIDVSLQVTPSADNPAGRTFDLDALTEAIRDALDGTEVYVALDGADGDAEDYVSFTVDVYEVTDDLAADTLPEALIGTAPVEWAGRTFGELTPDEQRRAAQAAGTALTAELAGFDQ